MTWEGEFWKGLLWGGGMPWGRGDMVLASFAEMLCGGFTVLGE
jgi:hypothetical protein